MRGDWNLGRKDIFAMGIEGNGIVKIIRCDKTPKPMTVSKDYYGSNGTVNKGEDKEFVLFSLSCGGEHHRLAELYLLSNLKKVKGCYKDQVEDSYILPLSGDFQYDYELIRRLERLLTQFKQESYLIVDGGRRTALVTLGKPHETEYIGTFQRSNPAEAIGLGNWTLDGSTFWIVK